MQRILIALVFVILGALPAAADSGISFLPQPGGRIHCRVVWTAQSVNGPLSNGLEFDLIRRTATTLVISRQNAGGAPNLSVLKASPDGTLALSEEASATAADADLGDAIYALNLAIGATRDVAVPAPGSWQATLPAAATPKAESIAVSLVPANVAGSEFDFSGTGQSGSATAPPRRGPGRVRPSGGGMPGGGGGGMPGGGGGYPRVGGGGQSDLPDAPAPNGNRNGVSTVMRVDGHVSGGNVSRVTVTQTRSVNVASMPFFNVASWSVTVVK